MVGTLNVIDGIAAISNSTFFTENARYVISNLNTFGWIVLILGSCQVLAAFGPAPPVRPGRRTNVGPAHPDWAMRWSAS